MYRHVAMLFLSKPVSQGYIASLPPPPGPSPGRQWMRAMDANSDVREFYTPDAARYEAWYKETYQLEDLSDGCAASGASSNRVLDDSKNIQRAAEDYDLEYIQEELQYWYSDFMHLNQLKSDYVTATWDETYNNFNHQDQPYMVVIDPVTCMFHIPLIYIQKTRAQNRIGLPFLCQLYLNNRCRQGSNCFQVHADLNIVMELRAKVGKLPRCCVTHGDVDHIGIYQSDPQNLLRHPSKDEKNGKMDGTSGEGSRKIFPADFNQRYALNDVVLYIPGCTMASCDISTDPNDDGSPYIPIKYCSYTLALRNLLLELDVKKTPTTSKGDNGEKTKIILDASNTVLCRMHILDRCLYAEECKFLHLCKYITSENPELIHSMGLHMNHRYPRKSRNAYFSPCPNYFNTPFSTPDASEVCYNIKYPRACQNPSDSFYFPSPTDDAPRHKEHPHARKHYMWDTDNAPHGNFPGYLQNSISDPNRPFFSLRSKRKNSRSLLVSGCRYSEPNSDEASAMARISSPRTTDQQPCHHNPRASQPYSIDICPDTNFASSLSTFINDKTALFACNPKPETNSSKSDSLKMSNDDVDKKNECHSPLLNLPATVQPTPPKVPLPAGQRTPPCPPEAPSQPSLGRDACLRLDANAPKPASGELDVMRNFLYQSSRTRQTPMLFDKPATQPKSGTCWKHNPYTGMMLDDNNLFQKDTNV